MNRVELSPLTFRGMAKRITADLHPGRSESAMCFAVNLLAEVASGNFTPAEAAEQLRGLAVLAKPDEYAELVRQTLAEATSSACQLCHRPTDEELCERCQAVAVAP